jgi:pyochelin synthetase
VFELTDLQQAYWIGERGGSELGNAVPHIYQEYEIPNCDLSRLEVAWQLLVQRHEALRTRITADGQIEILERVPTPTIEVTDVRAGGQGEVERQAQARRQRMTYHGPSSTRWPPFEVAVSWIDGVRARLHLSISLLVTDAWGLAILLGELHALYGDPATPLPQPGRMGPYREQLQAYRGTDAFARSLAYWRGRLASLPPGPELPQVLGQGTVATARPSLRSWTLGSEDAQAFRARAAKARLTPSVALCTAYADVIAGYSKTKRFTLNQLVSLRTQFQALDVVDNLSSTLFVEIASSAKQTFIERARSYLRQTLTDLPHSAVGGVQVTREAARMRGEAARVTAPVVFAGLYDAATLPGWQKVHDRVQTVQVLLDYSAEQEDLGIVHYWEVIDEAFPPGLVDAMFERFCDSVARLARDDEAWSARTPVVVPAAQLARRRLINATDAPISDELLHTAVQRHAALRPDAPAVITEGRTLSYGEVSRRSCQVARWLRERGVTRGTCVAVHMERGWEQVVAVLGILQAGGAYVPIDAAYPGERVARILDRTSARLILTQSHLPGDACVWPAGVEWLDVDRWSDAPAEWLAPVQGPDDLAYIIFTSGSTGTPKGVAIAHRGAVNTIRDINERFDVGSTDRVLALSLLNFDLSVYDIFGLLGAGGAIVIPSPESARLPNRWRQLVAEHQVTIWNSVPAYMQMMLGQGDAPDAPGGSSDAPGESERYASLRVILLSGDWIPVELPARARDLIPHARLISLGGATEASIWSIIHPIDLVDPAWRSIPYGRPMRNQRWFVLDDDLEPRPDLVPGQLYIGGIGLAMGYWGDAELTRAAFLDHPTLGERLYRTGDWGRYHPSGDIEFLGRDDGQVKIRGFRIELGEIEHVLRQHPAVRDAVVIVQGQGDNRQLIAYLMTDLAVAPAREPDATSEAPGGEGRATARVPFGARWTLEAEGPALDLRGFARSKLPAYMVPSAFVLMDGFPLSANGKVDRSQLPDLAAVGAASSAVRGQAFTAPRTPAEQTLAAIFEELLHQRPISVADNFFELGGNSLLGVRLMERHRAAFGVALPLSTLFTHPTVEAIARLVTDHATAARPASPLVAIRVAGADAPLFCVHPSGGGVLCYQPLARLLPANQSLYGLEAVPGGETCEEIAAHYVAAIREVAPHGPYRLAGWSSGGVVAFEMARQLHASGAAIEHLVLIDSWVPVLVGDDAEPSAEELLLLLARDLLGERDRGAAQLRDALRAPSPEEPLSRVLGWMRQFDETAGLALPDLARIHEVYTRNIRASLRYRPRALEVPALLLRCREQRFADFPDPAAHRSYGWDRLIPRARLRVEEVPGDHYDVLRSPNVEVVAAILSEVLHG